MTRRTPEQILDDLRGILRNLNDRDYSGDIGMHTRFFADLGMASIDAVVLGEKIEEHYGQKVPFNTFFEELGRRLVRDAQVGELVSFLHRHLKDKG